MMHSGIFLTEFVLKIVVVVVVGTIYMVRLSSMQQVRQAFDMPVCHIRMWKVYLCNAFGVAVMAISSPEGRLKARQKDGQISLAVEPCSFQQPFQP